MGQAQESPVSQAGRATLRARRRAFRISREAVLHAILIPLGFTFLVPFLWLLTTSLKTSGQVFIVPVEWIPYNPQWSNFVEIFQLLPLAVFIRNTGIVSFLGAAGSVFSSLLVGYSLARLRWPGRNVVFVALLGTMMLPGVVTLIPIFVMYSKIGWLDTLYPLFVPSWLGSGFYIFLMRQYMMGLPIELDEAARIDGAASFRILWQVVAPLCGPVIAAVAIFSFLAHYNDFMYPLIFLSSTKNFTLPLGIYWIMGRWGTQWHLVMAASVVSVLPVLLLFTVAQRHFIRGVVLSGLAGR